MLRWLVLGSLFAGAGTFLCTALVGALDRRLLPLMFGGMAMVGSQFLSFLAAGSFAPIDSTRLIETIAQQALVVMWIGFGLVIDWRHAGTVWIAVLTGIAVMTANLGNWAANGLPIPYEGLSTGKNGLASAACVGILVAIAPTRSIGFWGLWASRLLGFLSLVTLVASGGRASLIFLMVFLLSSLAFPYLKRIKLGPIFVTVVVMALLSIAPFIYINLERMPGFSQIDAILSRITHSAFSGRESLWPEVINGISEHPIVGNGTSASWRFERRAHGLVQDLSAHNLYLAILYQTGVIGLLGFVWLIGSILHCLWIFPDIRKTAFSFAVLMAALSREVWEVSLTQNTLQVGLGMWILITLGLSMSQSDRLSGSRSNQ